MTNSKRKPGPPIIAHRLFPAVAGAWLAALFGLASLAVPTHLLERIVVKIGLPHIVPAAAPPLGFTAHILVSLLLTVAGGLVGLGLALLLASRTRKSTVHLRPSAVRKPVVRTAQAVAPDSVRVEHKVRARDAHPDAAPRRPLMLSEDLIAPDESAIIDLADIDEADDSAASSFDRPTPFDAEGEDAWPFGPIEQYMAPRPLGQEPPFAPPAAFVATGDGPFANPVVQEPSAPEWFTLAPIDPATFAPVPATAQPAIASAETSALEASDNFANDAPGEAPVAACANPQAAGAGSPVAGVPCNGLGLVELVERLAHAIVTRRARMDHAAPGQTPTVQAPAIDADPEPAIVLPPLTSAGAAPPVYATPVVPFRKPRTLALAEVSGAAPLGNADEADQALRAALATLQRMTARS